jgi:hypothetical protein
VTAGNGKVRVEIELDDPALWSAAVSLLMGDERLTGHILSLWVTVEDEPADT